MFQVYNAPSEDESPIQIEFKTHFGLFFPTWIDVNAEVTNTLKMGKTRHYYIDAADNFFTQVSELRIELESTFGDADLLVTIDGKQFTSNSQL